MTPVATYRIQLHAGFTFDDAAALVPYLRDLGISHLYCSPPLASAPGSTHGYDVVDPARLDGPRGGEVGFARLRAAAEEHGLGLVLDIVPNHVGLVLPDNRWWWSVLREGPDSRYADHFDIAWEPGPTGRPQLVWPVLGESFDEVVAAGDIGADVLDGELVVTAHGEHRLPTRPGTIADHGLPDDPGEAARVLHDDPGLMRRVVDDQHWLLVHWQAANQRLRHRRFFDITTLGGVRVEDPAVFADVHARVARLVDDDAIDGLRVDHPDGLWDPAGYLDDLRGLLGEDRWLVVEKILEAGEERRGDWAVDGTVGYSFLNAVLGLFVDPRADVPLSALYDQLLGARQDPVAIAADARREALGLFDAELDRLVDLLVRVANDGADPVAARTALEELALGFPVYRTYVVPARDEITADDHAVLDEALATARARLPEQPLLDVLDDVLRLRRRGGVADELVHRFQQLTGPVMAKGVEDTTFYRYLRFVAVNEVGGHPSHLGTTPTAFHRDNAARAASWPATMLTTSTHDTKRAEDVRARLATVSELPDLWARTVHRLERITASHVGIHGPSPRHRYLLWQTLLGTWPISEQRLLAYLEKAAREGKAETSWLAPDEGYEQDLAAFARAVLHDDEVSSALQPLLDVVVPAGRLTSLSQTLLRLTVPGVPDTYQGCETWDLSLVDPDNRRAVDHHAHRELLAWLDADPAPTPEEILARTDEGAPKLHLLSRTLRLRASRPGSFGVEGRYQTVPVNGPRADHVVAFRRGLDTLVVAPRLVVGLSDGSGRFEDWDWRDTTVQVPGGAPAMRDVMTGQAVDGGHVSVQSLLDRFPVAVLAMPRPWEGDR